MSGYGSMEDGMWEVVLTDGSIASILNHPEAEGTQPKAGKASATRADNKAGPAASTIACTRPR